MRIFLLIEEMEKGPTDYLQILKELFNYIEPLSVSVEDFNDLLSPDIPVGIASDMVPMGTASGLLSPIR